MDFIDDKVYNENDISEIGKGKSSDQENMNDDFLDTKTRSEDYNSKSVNNDVQSEEIQSRTTDFHKNNKTVYDLVNTSSSNTTEFTENHGGIQKKSLTLHSNGSRMRDQVWCEDILI